MWSRSASRPGLAPLVGALALTLLGPAALPAQEPPAIDASDVLDALLTGLLGFRSVDEAELRRDVEEIGGVRFRELVPLDYMDRADLTRYLEELFDDEYPAQRASADERTLRGLDLLGSGVDLRELRRRLLLENVVGFYDERPGRRRLYAVSSERLLTPANQLVLAHELRHALQDQHMSIHGLLDEGVSDFDDRRLALLSLLEGDATLVMERFLARRLGRPEQAWDSGPLGLPAEALPGAPPVLREQMLAPYLSGLAFVRRLEESGSWQAVRRAWDSPPRSMEQVLHAEKYLAGEEPLPVELSLMPEGGRLVAQGVLGEALVRTLLDGNAAAAAGWGGDRYQTWEAEGRTVVGWRSLWDTPEDRDEFLAALLERFARAHRSAGQLQTGGWELFSAPDWHFAIGAGPGAAVTLVSSDEQRLLLTAVAQITARPSGP